jgi:hypothetical protein
LLSSAVLASLRASSIVDLLAASTSPPCSRGSSRSDQAVELVARLDRFAPLAVLVGVLLRVTHHLLDLALVQTARRGDADRLLLTGAEILGVRVHDAVGVDVERHLDLRQAAWARNAGRSNWPSSLLSPAISRSPWKTRITRRLVVGRGREGLALLGGDGGVSSRSAW